MQAIPTFDLYRELGVPTSASAVQIDAAWKHLVKRHHPDIAVDPDQAHEIVKRLNVAHEWLADPEKRARYDRSRRRPVVVMPRDPRPGSDPARRATAVPPQAPSRGGPDPVPGAASRLPQTSPPIRTVPADRAQPDGGVDDANHNPYREFGGPGRSGAQVEAVAPVMAEPRGAARRSRTLIVAVPLALMTILIVVFITYAVGVGRPAGVVAEASPAASTGNIAGATSPAASTRTTPGSVAVGPRSLPAPDLAAQLPSSCGAPDLRNAFNFETNVAATPAKVYVVQCDAKHAFGPLVYIAGTDTWELVAMGRLVEGRPYKGFGGNMTGTSNDEFGIAWFGKDEMRSTVALYHVTGPGVQRATKFWDSAPAGVQWALADYIYSNGDAAMAPGLLTIVAADLDTGTRNCATCRDHELYRAFYKWGVRGGTEGLFQLARQPYGLGPTPAP